MTRGALREETGETNSFFFKSIFERLLDHGPIIYLALRNIFSGIMYLLVVLRCGDFLYLNFSLILWEEDTLHGFWRRKLALKI